MKKGIHPAYKLTKYSCACGNEFSINSTHAKDMHIDICPNCHPLFTGKEKLVDTEGRVEKFRRRYASVQPAAAKKKAV